MSAFGHLIDWVFVNNNQDLLINWWIEEQGWDKFLSINEKAYADLVYLFYANFAQYEDELERITL